MADFPHTLTSTSTNTGLSGQACGITPSESRVLGNAPLGEKWKNTLPVDYRDRNLDRVEVSLDS